MAEKLVKKINLYIGTNAERLAMTTTYVPIGSEFSESDTGTTYTWTGGAWYEKTLGSISATSAANTAILQGNVTLDGSAQQLSADTACKVLTIQAHVDNADPVYVGNSSVSSTVHMFILEAGESVTLTINNLNLIYVRGTNTELVSYGGEV